MPDSQPALRADLDLPIQGHLSRHPEAVAVFLEMRLGCVGCDFSAFDTLSQALDVHGVLHAAYFERLERVRREAPPASPPLPTSGDAP